jgi:hypothetical protein
VEPELEPLAAFKGEVDFQRGGGATFWWLHLAPTRNPPEELFSQTFFKTTQLHHRSLSTRGARAETVIGGAGAYYIHNIAYIYNYTK